MVTENGWASGTGTLADPYISLGTDVRSPTCYVGDYINFQTVYFPNFSTYYGIKKTVLGDIAKAGLTTTPSSGNSAYVDIPVQKATIAGVFSIPIYAGTTLNHTKVLTVLTKTSTIHVNVNGEWKDANVYVKETDWKLCDKVSINSNGTWKAV